MSGMDFQSKLTPNQKEKAIKHAERNPVPCQHIEQETYNNSFGTWRRCENGACHTRLWYHDKKTGVTE